MEIAFFGTSLTAVNDWQTNSFVQIIEKQYPEANIKNFGIGGANSTDIFDKIKKELNGSKKYDYTFIEMGTNDIFRKFQNRTSEAIDINTFKDNYSKSLDILLEYSENVVCLASPPVNNEFKEQMNLEIALYNNEVKALSLSKECMFLDIYSEFKQDEKDELWSDGLHLSKTGDKIISYMIMKIID